MFQKGQKIVAEIPPEVKAGKPLKKYPFFPESAHAHKWLDPLAENGTGIEIGGSAHNDFFIKNCINVDYTDEMTIFKEHEVELCGRHMPVGVVAFADDLPFSDSSIDYILNSHVFEHQCNPIKTLEEWHRVIRTGGIIYCVIPKRDALDADKKLPLSSLYHQYQDWKKCETYDSHPIPPGSGKYGHYHIYTVWSFRKLIWMFNLIHGKIMLKIVDRLATDDKVSNGFTVVIKVCK